MYDNIVSTEFTYAAEQSNEDDEANKTSWLGRLVWNESTTSIVGNNTASLCSVRFSLMWEVKTFVSIEIMC